MSEPNGEEFAQSTLSEAIENQIRDGNPPEAKKTLDRLISAGQSREEAIQLMAIVLAAEVQAILKEDRGFDSEQYIKALRALPALPAEK
jgi:hypothetical protein